jgi:hypothetical protein
VRRARSRVPLLVLLAAAACGPGSTDVPQPADVIGFDPGEDYKLADYSQITAYFEALAASSDRVILEEIGRSTLGEPLYIAMISTPGNLSRRERYKEIARTLAYARGVSDEEARALADEGKAIVWIDGGLHATEVAHGQVMPEMARHFATDESAETQRIRENAILLLMVNMNPDGLDIVADWYRSNVGTEFETASVPELYHHYIGHDNNRDWYMLTQVETQAVTRQLYHEWFPQIVYNQHQSGPFPGRIWMPPFENPVNPNLDPLLVSSLNQMGHSMRKRFDVEGKPGVSSDIVYDLWWNGSMRGGPDFHNMLGFLTETSLYRYATPGCYDEIPESFSARAGGIPARTPSTNYNNPWEGGCWHLRDAMDYMMTAAIAVADMGAKLKDEYLFNIYWMGKRQIERGERAEGGPFAYVIDPEASHDPGTAIELLRLFHKSGIEIHRAEEAFSVGGSTFPAGSYVIPPQAFRPYVVDLMEPKTYPDRRQYPGGPPEPPYDMTGYELRYQLGVAASNIDSPFEIPGAPIRNETDIRRAMEWSDGPALGDGPWLLPPSQNASVALVAALLAEGASVSRSVGGATPAGTWRITGVDPERMAALAAGHEVPVRAQDSANGDFVPVAMPSIGIYRSWQAPMPEGWTRWVLDQYDLPWENLWDEDIRTRDLSDFDVIVLPAQSASGIKNGHAPGSMPEKYVGGLGEDGSRALQRFVADGGWLVAVDDAVDFALEEFRLPFRNPVGGLSSSEFFLPGSIIRLEVDTDHPLGWGMDSEAVTLFARSQVLTAQGAPRGGPGAGGSSSAACFGEAGDYMVSGWALGGDEHLAGRTAAAQVGFGEGQVVLFGFTPHFRGQPRNTYKLLFNALFASATDGLPNASGLGCS